jgi:hypothetical protein
MNEIPFQKLKIYDTANAIIREVKIKGDEKSPNLVIINGRMDAELEDYLKKILKSVGLEMDRDVCLYEFLGENAFVRISKLNFKKVISFGIDPKHLGLNVKAVYYTVIQLGGKKIVFSESIHDIFAERMKKERKMALLLWNSLKELF